MAVRSKEIEIDCRDSLSNNIYQFFPYSGKPPTICKLIFGYPEEVEYDCTRIQKFNEWFKSCLSHNPAQSYNSTDKNESRDGIDHSPRIESERLEFAPTKSDKNSTSSRDSKQPCNKSDTSKIEPLPRSKVTWAGYNSELLAKYLSVPSGLGEHKMQSLPTVLEEKEHSTCDKDLSSTWIDMLHNHYHPTSSTSCIDKKQCTEKDSDEGKFTKHLQSFQDCGCPYEGTGLCVNCHEFWPYILHHLNTDTCKKNICALWKLCLKKSQYSIFKVAPKGMVLFSHDKNKIGAITFDYANYRTKPNIVGMGGFARVFHHSVRRGTSHSNIAIKEEKRSSSLISDLKRFTSVKDLDHPNVLQFKEYVVGYHGDNNDTKPAPLLLVMEHYEKRGLNEPFKTENKKCLLDYMSTESSDTKYIFRNLLVISLDLFKALDYFAGKDLVHRDVKRSNVLLKLECSCSSAIECTCYGTDGRGGVTAILSDFDLVEKATSDDKWAGLRNNEPAGTRGMKAPELFFVNGKDKDTFTAKADIWSAFLTIMHVLLGRDVNDIPLTKVTELFQDTTSRMYHSSQEISSCIKDLEDHSQHCDKCKDQDHITKNIEVLKNIQKSIEQLCRFQGGRPQPTMQKPSKTLKKDHRDNYCPAAEVLTAVHGATVMPQICISKVQHVFESSNSIQKSIRELWDIIQDGMCFRPENRPDAKKVVGQLSNCLDKFLKSDLFK